MLGVYQLGSAIVMLATIVHLLPPRYTAVLTLRVGIIKQFYFHKISHTDGKTSVILSV